MEMNELVAAAKKKNSKALEEIYKRTNQTAYYTALAITKNAEDASDIVQDTYINVFSNIDTIQDNSFTNYLKMAVANACKNNLKKKHAILFSNDEEESNALNSIEEPSEDFLPDMYIEQAAKRKQIMTIINSLSDVQRATILFYYFNEMSIKEIAEAMECNESTVKSRIAYAKKHIKNEVEKLEQQGDKLYGKAFIPVPFLRKLFVEDSKNHKLPEAAAKAIFHNVISSAAAGSTGMGGFVASGLFAKFAGLKAAGKAAIAGAGAVMIVGGSVAGMAATGHLNNNPVKAAATASSSEVAATSSQVANSMYENSSSTVTSSNLVCSSAASSATVSTASTVSSKAIVQTTVSASHPVQKAASKASATKTSSKSTSSAKISQSRTTTLSGDVAGNDSVANAQWISSHLGFYNSGAGGAYYNPSSNKYASALIRVGYTSDNDTCITLKGWDADSNIPGSNTIKSKAQQLFKFYLPNNYMRLYNMIEAWDDGSDAYTGKTYTIDGRSVRFIFYEDAGQMQIYIGKK